ncbi:DUF2267 domain-containing protein [Aestuariicoccus sp. MJ-SS9]|uniref:DUF2267 domain-containing protein n=1 Tax=Aestuariicoccus sp. MJ-SS9 TaxID=3079855 RepID=UPI002914BFBF|nr:DUF2267 domain-containing protein [Aestuariicoccus sp. MJ-SS9]MDU8912453.1 DUF2267 domain-containing protein [Aestuariicoccus sp. MJ-SS9]
MSAQGLEVIDHTVSLTHEWINELSGRLDWSSHRSALRLMRVTLHHIRDHLQVNELAQFSAQLPLLIRGIFFEGWVPKTTPIKERTSTGFLMAIGEQMKTTPEFRGDVDIRRVFDLLNARISAGEIADIRASLPADIRDLWPAP